MTPRRRSLGLSAVVFAGCIAALSAKSASTEGAPALPDPTSGPGVSELTRSQTRKLGRAWREFVSGDYAESRSRVARAGAVAPAELLGFQIEIEERGLESLDELLAFCGRHPDYAAAWITLSIAAERAGSEATAYDAAVVGADLWPGSTWQSRPAELHRRWVEDRLARAGRLLESGDPGAALVEIDGVETVEPRRQDAAMLRAQALVDTGRADEAEELLAQLTDLPAAVFLSATIAEDRGDLQTAMHRYAALPTDYPGRAEALSRTQTRWRLTLLPSYARASLNADRITRADLAVILVSLQPRLATLPGGPVPVMSDVVDHPGQREIITVVRLGIMSADRLEHRFYPDVLVDTETVREAVERTRALAGLPALVWCADLAVVRSTCTTIPSPPNGSAVAAAVLDSSGAD
jgi:hypothetical protein